MTNRDKMREYLTGFYTVAFLDDPKYAGAASLYTPEAFAAMMVAALAAGDAVIGESVKAACKYLGVKPTTAAIKAFLQED